MKQRVFPCAACGLHVFHAPDAAWGRAFPSLMGSTLHPVAHHGPCGLLCIGAPGSPVAPGTRRHAFTGCEGCRAAAEPTRRTQRVTA